MDGGSIVVEVRADLARFDREMARARAQVADAESRRGAWTTTGRGRRDADAFLAETRALRQRADALQENVRAQERLAAADRRASLVARVGAVGLALNRAGANLQELSDNPGAWSSRAGGFLTNITSGNVVGAMKAAGETAKLTAEQIQLIGTSSDFSDSELRGLTAALRSVGQSGAADEIARVRSEMQSLAAATFAARTENVLWTAQGAVTVPRGTRPDDIGGMQGVGAVSAGNFNRADATAAFSPQGKLNAWLRQRLALASTTPGKQDDIAATRRAIQYLQRLTKDARIVGEARTNLYTELAQQQASLAALTAKDPAATKDQPILPAGLELGIAKAQLTTRISDDLAALRKAEKYLEDRIKVEKNINRQVEQTTRLGQIRERIAGLRSAGMSSASTTTAAAVLGPLGGGEFLTGDRMQFAQSFGYTPRPRDFMRDLKQGNAQAYRFLRDIGALRSKGASAALVSELAALGPQAGDQIHALAGASKQFIGAYSAAVDRRQDLAAQTVRLQEMTVTAGQVTIKTGAVVGGNGAGRTLTSTSTVDRFQMTHGAF